MADIKYVGSSVNSAVNQLTSVSNRFQPVANDVRTKTGVMIGCKGFGYIGAGASSDIYSGVITACEQKVAGLVGDIRRKQSTILSYSQNQSDIDDFVDSLSTQEYYALKDSGALKGFDKKISGWAKAGFIADNIFSTACTFALGFVEGVGDFVESVGDGVIMLAGSAVSGVADLVGADDFANEVSQWTRATVAYDVTGNAFDSLYANTEFGQYLQNNSTVFDQARGFGNGLGYATGVIAANALFPGVGMAGFAAAAGFGNAGERAFADGAELGEGLAYSAASAGWEAVQWTVGAKIGGLNVPGASKLANAALRVGLDGIDSGLEGFVQPGLTMIYKDYPGETFAEQYGAAFNQNGGWNTVWTQVAVGSTMSAASEAMAVFKGRKGKGDADADGTTPKGEGGDGGTTPDGGTPDAGTPDGGTPDAGTPDAGTPDAGTPDAGTPDAGTPDAGTPDAGTPDAGTTDAGTPATTPDGGTTSGGGSTPDGGTTSGGGSAPDGGTQARVEGDNGPTSYTDKTVNPDGSTTTTTLDSDANVTSQINEYKLENSDGSTSFVRENVDADGNITGYTDKTVAPDGTVTTTTLDADGNVTATTKEYDISNPDGSSSHVTESFDGNGNQTGYTDKTVGTDGVTTTTTLDADGNVTGQTNEYTLKNNDGSTSYVRETVDADGNITDYTDRTVGADGTTTTTTTLDSDAKVTGQTNEYELRNNDGSTSHVTETIDADGNITEYTDRTVNPDGTTTTTTLDSDANVTSTTQEYDLRNNDGSTSHVTETYNGDPSVRPDTDPNIRPDEPNIRPDEPNVRPDEPTVKPDEPTVKPDEPTVKPDDGTRTWRDRVSDAWDSTKHTLGDAADRVRGADYLNNIHPAGVARDMTETVIEGQPHGIDAGFDIPVSDDPYGIPDSPIGEDVELRETYEDPIYPSDPPTTTPPTTPTTPQVPTTPTDPYVPTEPTTPTLPTDPIGPTGPTGPEGPTGPTGPTDPYNPGNGGGHSGSGFGGTDEFNGAAFSLDDEFGDDFDSIADIISRGSGNIPSSSSPLRSGGGGVSAFIPISAGLSAAAAVGLGTKALLDKKNKEEDEDEEDDDNLESYLFEDEVDSSFDESFDDDDSFIPEELLLED